MGITCGEYSVGVQILKPIGQKRFRSFVTVTFLPVGMGYYISYFPFPPGFGAAPYVSNTYNYLPAVYKKIISVSVIKPIKMFFLMLIPIWSCDRFRVWPLAGLGFNVIHKVNILFRYAF